MTGFGTGQRSDERQAHKQLVDGLRARLPDTWRSVYAGASDELRSAAIAAEAERPGAGVAMLEAQTGAADTGRDGEAGLHAWQRRKDIGG